MREELLGYLLGALDADEMQRVSAALRSDPKLRAELDQLAAMLKPLDEAHDLYEPPAGLLERTLDSISESEMSPLADGGVDQTGDLTIASQVSAVNHDRDADAATGVVASNFTGRNPSVRVWHDVIALVAVAVLLAGLFFPALLRERAVARQQTCQSQLRTVGIGLTEYALDRPDGRLPQLSLQGPDSFAGYYAIALRDSGKRQELRPLWCPSLDVLKGWEGMVIPSRDQLMRASPAQLVRFQQGIGGHYAYSLGVIEGKRYLAPRYQGRSHFAILADAPMQSLDGWVMAHEGRGSNILFEDGHIRFMSNWDEAILGDHPFLNHSGEIAYGLDPNDASLAPSHFPPVTPIRNVLLLNR